MAVKQAIRRAWSGLGVLDRQLVKLSAAALLVMAGQSLFAPTVPIAWPLLLGVAVALAARPVAGTIKRCRRERAEARR